MDRRLIAGLLGLLVTGCALSESRMPEVEQKRPSAEPDRLPPIKDSTNPTAKLTDAATRRAEHDPASDPPPPKPGEAASTAPPDSKRLGRPAPFADRAEPRPRLQAPPASGRPEDQPGEARPSQSADRPAVERPRAPTASQPTARPLRALPPILPPAVAPTAEAPAVEAPPIQAPTAAADPAKSDSAVVPTSVTPPPPQAKQEPSPPSLAGGGQAALVGNEVITHHQLRAAIQEQKERMSPEQWSDPQVKFDVTRASLNRLVERTLILQALKKQVKDPKNLQAIYDSMDKMWIEKELPPLLRQAKVSDIHELKRKYAEAGKSLDAIRADYRYDALAHEYMLSKIQSKMTVSLPEKQKYYTEHLKDFDHAAEVTWREIDIENAKCANREEARRKTEVLLARLKTGENFAKLAQAESQGATAREGGLWKLAPGGYGVPEVNNAIDALASGQISGIVEAPGGFHIILVESKRDAGPRRFDEVQDEIKNAILQTKYTRLLTSFINKLRANTVVTTMFDNPEGDPSAVRTSAEASPAR